jgi:hypothetical protein
MRKVFETVLTTIFLAQAIGSMAFAVAKQLLRKKYPAISRSKDNAVPLRF